jgi:transposase
VRRVLAYREPVDLRKSFPGLVGLVKSMLAEDPLLGSVFVFINRRETLIKSTPPVGTLDVLYCRSLQ